MPTAFVEALTQSGPEVFVTSFDGKSAFIYPMTVWEEIASHVRALGEFHPSRRRFQRITNFYGQEAELDAQQRVVVPQHLRTLANIVGKVDVLGMGRHLEVWNHEALFSRIADEPLTQGDFQFMPQEGI